MENVAIGISAGVPQSCVLHWVTVADIFHGMLVHMQRNIKRKTRNDVHAENHLLEEKPSCGAGRALSENQARPRGLVLSDSRRLHSRELRIFEDCRSLPCDLPLTVHIDGAGNRKVPPHDSLKPLSSGRWGCAATTGGQSASCQLPHHLSVLPIFSSGTTTQGSKLMREHLWAYPIYSLWSKHMFAAP